MVRGEEHLAAQHARVSVGAAGKERSGPARPLGGHWPVTRLHAYRMWGTGRHRLGAAGCPPLPSPRRGDSASAPGTDLTKALQFAAAMEDEGLVHDLERRAVKLPDVERPDLRGGHLRPRSPAGAPLARGRAVRHGAVLCSADRDFARFSWLKWSNPWPARGGSEAMMCCADGGVTPAAGGTPRRRAATRPPEGPRVRRGGEGRRRRPRR